MTTYKKLEPSDNLLWDWFVSWFNLKYMRWVIIRIAWNEHLKTGREVHVSEMFGAFVIYDSRDRKDLNKSGRVGKMNVVEAMKASIWNSTSYKKIIKTSIK